MKFLELFARIKDYFSRNKIEEDLKYKDFLENVIPSLKFGDIIYAERFNNDIEKEDMGEGHTSGPFVVISFEEDKVVGAYCTSSPNVKGGFQIGENYNLFYRKKDTYMTLLRLKTIDAEAYMNTGYRSLSNSDIDRVKKKMCLSNIDVKYDDFGLQKDLNMNFDVDFEVGDVVSYGGQPFVIVEKRDDNKLILVPINNYDSHYSYIDFSNVRIDYSMDKEVDKKGLVYLNSINKTQVVIILKEYNDYIARKNFIINNEDRKLDRGCLVKIFGNLYYVYGTEGNIANCFSVRDTSLVDDTILIAGRRFIPYYENVKDIDIKNDSYQILNVASEMEMDRIKEARKSYKKSQKGNKQAKKSKGSKIAHELLVCLKSDMASRYIVCDEYDDMYTVVSVASLLANHEIVFLNLPKESFKEINYMTSTELKIIRSSLMQLESDNLSNELVKKMLLRLNV